MKAASLVLQSVVAAGDHAVVSAANFALGFALVKFAPKSEYGEYAIIVSGVLLGQYLLQAGILSPMLTVLPTLPPAQRLGARVHLPRIQIAFIATLGLIGGVICASVWGWNTGKLVSSWAVACATVGVLARESLRGTYYALQRAAVAFSASLLYSTVLLAGITLCLVYGSFRLLNALFAIAVAGAASTLVLLARRCSRGPDQSRVEYPQALAGRLLECARWSLPGVAAGWVMSFGYLYPLGFFSGTAVVADVSAARLFLVPATLLVTGCSKVFRPYAAQLLSKGKWADLKRDVWRTGGILAIIVLVLGGVVSQALPFCERWLPKDYGGLAPLVLAWTVYFCVQAVRTVAMSGILASQAGFRLMYRYGWIALGLAGPGILLASWIGSPTLVIASMVVGEVGLLALTAWFGWPSLRRALADVPPAV